MIIFDDLRIADNGKRLFIKAHVNTASYFDDIYIKNIIIMTADEVDAATNPNSPTQKYVYRRVFDKIYTADGQDPIATCSEVKTLDIELTKADLDAAFNNQGHPAPDIEELSTDTQGYVETTYNPNATDPFNKPDFSNMMLFIYVKCEGQVDPCTPCGLDEMTTLGVTYDEKALYQATMNFTKELAGSCQISNDFIDFILKWTALNASLNTEHFADSIKFWKMLFGEDGQTLGNVTTRKCKCNG